MRDFLAAVLGPECAAACAATADTLPGLTPGWVALRAATAWVRAAGDRYEGPLPVGGSISLAKGAAGYTGCADIGGTSTTYRDATESQLAGLVAAAAGLGPAPAPTARASTVARLGGIIEAMAKASKNAREQRRNITAEQADQRRQRYARSLGLVPVRQRGDHAQVVGTPKENSLGGKGDQVRYGGQYTLPHELGHAMFTGPGETVGQHGRKMTRWAVDPERPEPEEGEEENFDDDWHPERDFTSEYLRAGNEEDVIATSLEHKIERRAGVDPHRFGMAHRGEVRDWDHEQDKTIQGGWNHLDPDDVMNHRDRTERAAEVIGQFDAGARFDQKGRVQPAAGLDARISARAGKEGAAFAVVPRPTHKSETLYCTRCRDPLDKDGHCRVKAHWAELDKVEAPGPAAKPIAAVPAAPAMAPKGPKQGGAGPQGKQGGGMAAGIK